MAELVTAVDCYAPYAIKYKSKGPEFDPQWGSNFLLAFLFACLPFSPSSFPQIVRATATALPIFLLPWTLLSVF